MKSVSRVYQYMSILSIDVVLGSIVSALFFGRLFGNEVNVAALVSLGLTVWIIYTADHLRDARDIPGTAYTDRHRFHQRYFKAIMRTLTVVIVINVLTVTLMPVQVIAAGGVLSMFILFYLIGQHRLKFMKEFFIALLYTAGVLMPSVSVFEETLLVVHYIIVAKFATLALMNLLLFSLIDLDADRCQKQHSFVTFFGPRATSNTILLLGILNIMSGFWLWELNLRVAIMFILMNLTLLTILFLKQSLVRNNYYRLAGDAVFFIPLVMLI